jgi:ABC-type dipeptide/oligopeptide/nickel transport system ATPase subunit
MGMTSPHILLGGASLVVVLFMGMSSVQAAIDTALNISENRLERTESDIVRSGETHEVKFALNLDLLPRTWVKEGKHNCHIGGTQAVSRALAFASIVPAIHTRSVQTSNDSLANDTQRQRGTKMLEEVRIGNSTWARRIHQQQSGERQRHRLSIVVYFKNEGHILFEWVMQQHHPKSYTFF